MNLELMVIKTIALKLCWDLDKYTTLSYSGQMLVIVIKMFGSMNFENIWQVNSSQRVKNLPSPNVTSVKQREQDHQSWAGIIVFRAQIYQRLLESGLRLHESGLCASVNILLACCAISRPVWSFQNQFDISTSLPSEMDRQILIGNSSSDWPSTNGLIFLST